MDPLLSTRLWSVDCISLICYIRLYNVFSLFLHGNNNPQAPCSGSLHNRLVFIQDLSHSVETCFIFSLSCWKRNLSSPQLVKTKRRCRRQHRKKHVKNKIKSESVHWFTWLGRTISKRDWRKSVLWLKALWSGSLDMWVWSIIASANQGWDSKTSQSGPVWLLGDRESDPLRQWWMWAQVHQLTPCLAAE